MSKRDENTGRELPLFHDLTTRQCAKLYVEVVSNVMEEAYMLLDEARQPLENEEGLKSEFGAGTFWVTPLDSAGTQLREPRKIVIAGDELWLINNPQVQAEAQRKADEKRRASSGVTTARAGGPIVFAMDGSTEAIADGLDPHEQQKVLEKMAQERREREERDRRDKKEEFEMATMADMMKTMMEKMGSGGGGGMSEAMMANMFMQVTNLQNQLLLAQQEAANLRTENTTLRLTAGENDYTRNLRKMYEDERQLRFAKEAEINQLKIDLAKEKQRAADKPLSTQAAGVLLANGKNIIDEGMKIANKAVDALTANPENAKKIADAAGSLASSAAKVAGGAAGRLTLIAGNGR